MLLAAQRRVELMFVGPKMSLMLTLLLLAAAPAASNAIIWTGSADETVAKEKLGAWAKDERVWSERCAFNRVKARPSSGDRRPSWVGEMPATTCARSSEACATRGR